MMRRAGAAAAIIAVIVVLAAVLRPSHKVARSNIPVQLSSPTPPPSSGAVTGTSTPPKASAHGTYTGAVEQNQYGPVQVSIALSAGRITAVHTDQVPEDRPRSQSINAQAVPILQSEVLQAQSASINLVSGATFTSEGFAASLQSAISQEH